MKTCLAETQKPNRRLPISHRCAPDSELTTSGARHALDVAFVASTISFPTDSCHATRGLRELADRPTMPYDTGDPGALRPLEFTVASVNRGGQTDS